MVKLLLDREVADNDVVENIGSPLFYAGRVAHFDSARLLIEAGADLDSVDIVGHSALHVVIFRSQPGTELFNYFVGLVS